MIWALRWKIVAITFCDFGALHSLLDFNLLKAPSWQSLSGHYSHDWSEDVRVISEAAGVNGRRRKLNIRLIV